MNLNLIIKVLLLLSSMVPFGSIGWYLSQRSLPYLWFIILDMLILYVYVPAAYGCLLWWILKRKEKLPKL